MIPYFFSRWVFESESSITESSFISGSIWFWLASLSISLISANYLDTEFPSSSSWFCVLSSSSSFSSSSFSFLTYLVIFDFSILLLSCKVILLLLPAKVNYDTFIVFFLFGFGLSAPPFSFYKYGRLPSFLIALPIFLFICVKL